jgi:hypothetical protein
MCTVTRTVYVLCSEGGWIRQEIPVVLSSRIREIPTPCYLKHAESVNGIDIHRCVAREELEKHVYNLPEGCPFRCQEEMPPDSVYLNIQYMPGKTGARHERIRGGASGFLRPIRGITLPHTPTFSQTISATAGGNAGTTRLPYVHLMSFKSRIYSIRQRKDTVR